MVRTPLDLLLITDDYDSRAEARLRALGGAVTPVSFDLAEVVMRVRLRVADAIVLDTSSGNTLRTLFGNDYVTRAANSARAIRRLPGHVAMPTGTKWNSIPIVILVRDEMTAAALRSDPQLQSVHVCITDPVENWYYEYVNAWPGIYANIEQAVDDNVLARLEQMRSLGHTFNEITPGVLIRHAPPTLRRRNGTLPELESAAYYGPADTMLRRRLRNPEHWRGRDVVRWEPLAIERALYEYEHLLKTARSEQEMQDFLSRYRYLLGAGVHDVLEHPIFQPYQHEPRRIPDFYVRSFNLAIQPLPATVCELKRPDAQLIVKEGHTWKLSGVLQTAVEQSRDYADIVEDPRNAEHVQRRVGEVPQLTRKRVIAGRASQHDASVLQRLRARYLDVQIQGYDEHLASEIRRLAS